MFVCSTDPNGCVVIPVIYELSNITMSWQEARKHCISQGLSMASPNIAYTQKKLVGSLNSMNAVGFAWLGLRLGLVSSTWSWFNNIDFSYTNWDYNQPTSNMCASILMQPGGNFTWRSVRCCSPMQPLCGNQMVIVKTVNEY